MMGKKYPISHIDMYQEYKPHNLPLVLSQGLKIALNEAFAGVVVISLREEDFTPIDLLSVTLKSEQSAQGIHIHIKQELLVE